MSKKNVIESFRTPTIEQSDEIEKKLKIQFTGRQHLVNIPIEVIDALDIEKGDTFILKVNLKEGKRITLDFT